MNPIVVQILDRRRFNHGKLDFSAASEYFEWRTSSTEWSEQTAYRLGRKLTPGLDYLSNFLRIYGGNYRHG